MKAGMLRGICAAVAGLVLAGLIVAVPSQAGPGQLASFAKKKCKPKVPYGAAAAKKRCKRRKTPPIVLPGATPVTPVTPSVATSRERARVTWSADKDIDLHVWDQAGRHTYYALDEIPGGVHGGDVTTAGFEAFTDQQWFEPVPSGGNRVLSYGVCLRDAGPVAATLSVLLPDGSPFSQSLPALAQNAGQVVAPANGYTPAPGWCP